MSRRDLEHLYNGGAKVGPLKTEADNLSPGGFAISNSCDSCGEGLASGTPIILMGSHSDSEYGPCTYCFPCIQKAAALTR